ncbi:MAG: ABC transporter permease [Rhizomicrobium sp.]
MNFGRLWAIARKELLQVRRDPRSLTMALLLPVVQMLLLGYGVNLDIQHVPICTFDREASQNSEALLKGFAASEYFQITKVVNNYRDLTHAVDAGDCGMAIVVPQDFSLRLNDTGQSSVQVILDGTDDNTATVALGYAQSVIASFSNQVGLKTEEIQGYTQPPAPPLSVEYRVWYNEDLTSRNFIIPGLAAMILALVGAELTSLTISREWERGTMELLVSTPVTPMEVMLGKLLPYFAIGLVDAAICIGFAVFWFQVPFRGTFSTLFLTTALYLVVVIGIGYLLSVMIRSQLGASQIALVFTMLPATLLSGYAFPIDQMPAPIQAITYLVYARYYVTILKAVFLKGLGLASLGAPIACLTIYAAVVTFLAARAFRKTLD